MKEIKEIWKEQEDVYQDGQKSQAYITETWPYQPVWNQRYSQCKGGLFSI
jgi:hypothetical protein